MFMIGEYSLKPKYDCPVCGEALWTERSGRPRYQQWLFTGDRRRHYKTRCNLKKKTEQKMTYQQQLTKIKRWAKTDRRKWLFVYALCETADINVDSDGDVWAHNERVFDLVFNARACILQEALKWAKLYEEEWPGNGELDEFDRKTGRRM